MSNRYRSKCAAVSLLLLAAAFLDKFYRGPAQSFSEAYLGDFFIVGCLYFWLSVMLPRWPMMLKAAAIGFLALSVELFQATLIPASWNLPQPFNFLLGTAFDPKDFVFYFSGLAFAVLLDVIFGKTGGDLANL